MKTAAFLLMASFVLGAATMRDLVPTAVSGWKSAAKDASYDRRTLYDYIDGGAEVYLAYDFREVLSRRFVKPGEPAITLDLFEMGTSADAYGVFSFEREGPSVGIGQDSEYAAGYLRFWKGRYFVSILADRETPSSRKAVMALGKAIAVRIKSTGARPMILSYLPPENLIGTETRYFHRKSGLDYQYFLSDANILDLDSSTEVVLARYRIGKSKPRLLVVQYSDESCAAEAFRGFTSAFSKDERCSGTRLQGSVIIAVFESADRMFAGRLIDETISRMEVKKP